jgi:hypothetical protein
MDQPKQVQPGLHTPPLYPREIQAPSQLSSTQARDESAAFRGAASACDAPKTSEAATIPGNSPIRKIFAARLMTPSWRKWWAPAREPRRVELAFRP